MRADKHHRHPSQYTNADLHRLLRAERLALTQRLVILKREIRERAAEIEQLESRLADIEASETEYDRHVTKIVEEYMADVKTS